MRKLCFGGSFNPIHHGHLICARAVAEAAGFDQVVLVPSALPPHIGPTWLDLYRRVETLDTGETVTADEAYLTDSMIDPRAKIVKGYKPVMPTYKGKLSAPDAAALVEFIKSLRSQNLDNLPSKEATYEPARR